MACMWIAKTEFFDAKCVALKVHTTELCTEPSVVREQGLKHIWTSCVGGVIDTNQILTNAVFSCAMAVMDKVVGWSDDRRRSGRDWSWRIACGTTPRQLYAMVKRNMEDFRHQRRSSVIEAENWSCSGVLPNQGGLVNSP